MNIYSKVAKLKFLLSELLDIYQVNCYFCGKPITNIFGLTIHHINGNHDDNRRENRTPSHTYCHKAYHCSKTMNQRKKKKNMKENYGIQ